MIWYGSNRKWIQKVLKSPSTTLEGRCYHHHFIDEEKCSEKALRKPASCSLKSHTRRSVCYQVYLQVNSTFTEYILYNQVCTALTHWGAKEDAVLPTAINSPDNEFMRNTFSPFSTRNYLWSCTVQQQGGKGKKLPQGKQPLLSWWDLSFVDMKYS